MSKKILTTPISADDLSNIKIGDVIYLTGHIVTCRDVPHRRVVEEGRELPLDITGGAILHAGPIIRKTGVRLIVGKGGMGEGTMSGCKEFGAIHCVFPAGCAVVAATQVEKIESADWTELGMPETLWKCRVKEFGPLIVSIDAHGNNLFEQNKVKFNEKKDEALAEILPQVGFIK